MRPIVTRATDASRTRAEGAAAAAAAPAVLRHTLSACPRRHPRRSTSTCSSSAPASPGSTPPAGSRCTAPASRGPCSRRGTRSAGRGTCSATPASGPTPTCSRSASRSGRGGARRHRAAARRSGRYVEDTARSSASPSASTWASGSSGSSGPRRTPAGRSRPAPRGPGHPHRPVRLPRDGLLLLRVGPRRRVPGPGDFAGEVVHPQHWPEGLPVAGRRVVVIGSGATAVTLLPALVEQGAAHVTMLQRSPSYVAALPGRDVVADGLQRVLPAGAAPPGGARQERRPLHRRVPGAAPLPGCRAPAAAASGRAPAPRRVCRGHPLRPAVRPVGPAPLRRPGRRPLPRPLRRTGRGRHRHDRAVRARRHPDPVRCPAARGPRRHGHRAGDADRGRRRGRRRRGAGRPLDGARLQGADALRRPEPGPRRRVHERELDAAGRPLGAVVLLAAPVPRPHGYWPSPRPATTSRRSRARQSARCST